MQIDIRHLQLVDAVTETGSVTRAADRLNVTQSALSHQLREIEARLRTPLFLRVNRRLVLSPAGERLLASARRILGELRGVEEDIARIAAHQDGAIRLSTECYTCYHWLPPLLRPFHAKYPGVAVEIVAEATRKPVPALLERQIDLALVYRPQRDPRLRTTPLFDDELVVITAPDHALAKKPVVGADDLTGEHVILHSAASESFFAEHLAAANVMPRRYSQVTLTEAIVEMVKAGLGVSAVPRWTVSRDIRAGKLAALRFGRKGLLRKWAAATLRTQPSAPLSHFIGLIREHWRG